MSRKDKPYLPLYVQDFMTDEKLIECSASATGIYIRLMCIFHKQEEYGKILLKQKDKQNSNNIKNFAKKLARQMPYPSDEIEAGLNELLENKVIQIDSDWLLQKRMVDDSKLSDTRAEAGKKGSVKSKKKISNIKNFASANAEANTENDIESDTDIEVNNVNEVYKKFVEIYFSFHTNILKNPKPVFNAREGKSIKSLIKYFLVACADDEHKAIQAFQTMFDNWHLLDKFHAQWVDINAISNHITELINVLRNGTSNTKNGISDLERELQGS